MSRTLTPDRNGETGYERLVLETDPGVQIAIRRYASGGSRGFPVVLTHGLLASSDIFDVPGLPHMSLARFLRDQGHPVYSFDQRCARDSIGPNWDFGLRETALTDLPAVIRLVLDREQSERVALVAHSLGGLCQYLLLAALSPSAGPAGWLDGLDAGTFSGLVCIASPVRFSQGLEPWRTIARHPSRFLEKIDPDGDGAADLADFVQTSFLLPPVADRLLPAWLVGLAMRAGGRSVAAAGGLKSMPLRSFLYDPGDFDAATFRRVLASRTLQTGSAALVSEVLRAGLAGGSVPVEVDGRVLEVPRDLSNSPPIPLLTVSSALDALVPAADVEYAHVHMPGEHIRTERDLGAPSGHAGYFFKDGLRPRLYERIQGFLDGLT